MPLLPTNADAIELTALRDSGALGRLGRQGCDIFGFEYALLPDEAKRVLQRIVDGAPPAFPKDDGTIFWNKSRDLPGAQVYREFTVPTPDVDHRGKRRLVIRENGLTFFTACHYDRVRHQPDISKWRDALNSIDPRWRHGFYVVTGMPPDLRRALAAAMRRFRDARRLVPLR